MTTQRAEDDRFRLHKTKSSPRKLRSYGKECMVHSVVLMFIAFYAVLSHFKEKVGPPATSAIILKLMKKD